MAIPAADMWDYMFGSENGNPYGEDTFVCEGRHRDTKKLTYNQIHDSSIEVGKRLVTALGTNIGCVAVLGGGMWGGDFLSLVYGVFWARGTVVPVQYVYSTAVPVELRKKESRPDGYDIPSDIEKVYRVGENPLEAIDSIKSNIDVLLVHPRMGQEAVRLARSWKSDFSQKNKGIKIVTLNPAKNRKYARDEPGYPEYKCTKADIEEFGIIELDGIPNEDIGHCTRPPPKTGNNPAILLQDSSRKWQFVSHEQLRQGAKTLLERVPEFIKKSKSQPAALVMLPPHSVVGFLTIQTYALACRMYVTFCEKDHHTPDSEDFWCYFEDVALIEKHPNVCLVGLLTPVVGWVAPNPLPGSSSSPAPVITDPELKHSVFYQLLASKVPDDDTNILKREFGDKTQVSTIVPASDEAREENQQGSTGVSLKEHDLVPGWGS